MKNYHSAAAKAISYAAKHTTPDTRTSAGLCLQDAMACMASDRPLYAYTRAMDSLRYSVGVYGQDYAEAEALKVF